MGLGLRGRDYQGQEANGIGHIARVSDGRYGARVSRLVWATEEKRPAVPNLNSHRQEHLFRSASMTTVARRQGHGGSGGLGHRAVIAVSHWARRLGEVGTIREGASASSVLSIISKKRGYFRHDKHAENKM